MDSGRSQAKIDGSGFCSGGTVSICAGLPEPFQGLHGRQLISGRISSAHLGDRSATSTWSLQMPWLNVQKAAFIVKPYQITEDFAAYSSHIRGLGIEGERRITQP